MPNDWCAVGDDAVVLTPVSPRRASPWQRTALTPEEFRRAVEEEQLRSERGGSNFTVLLLDVADATGDHDAQEVLETATQRALQRVRLTDRIAHLPRRVAMLLPNTSERGARLLAEELMESWSNGSGAITRVTMSSFPSSGNGRNGYPWVSEEGALSPRIAAPNQTAFSPDIEAREARLGPLGAKAPIPLWKRLSDLVGAALALVGLGPLMLLIALHIWIVDRVPILFTQERVVKGLNDGFLSDEVFKTLGPPFSCKDDIAHILILFF